MGQQLVCLPGRAWAWDPGGSGEHPLTPRWWLSEDTTRGLSSPPFFVVVTRVPCGFLAMVPGSWAPGCLGEVGRSICTPLPFCAGKRPQHTWLSRLAQNFLFLSWVCRARQPGTYITRGQGFLGTFLASSLAPKALLRSLSKAGPPEPWRSGNEQLISLERERWLCWTVCGQCSTQQTTRASLRGMPPPLRRAQKKVE